jgi:hypothetical protein
MKTLIKTIQYRSSYPLGLIGIIFCLASCQLQDQGPTEITGSNSQGGGINKLAVTQSNGFVNFSNQTSYSIAGNCSEHGSLIKMLLGPLSNYTSCNHGTFGFTIDLSGAGDGTFTFNFEESISTGAKYTTSHTTTKDSLVPIVTPMADDDTPVSTKTLFWSCNELCTFRYAVSTSQFVFPSGFYNNITQVTIDFGVERYYLHVQAKDAAGNESAIETSYFFIDENLPAPLSQIATPSDLGSPSSGKQLSSSLSSDEDLENILSYSSTQMSAYEQTVCPKGWKEIVPEELASDPPPIKSYCQKL